MSPSVLTRRSLAERFAAEFPTSKKLHDQAREVFPDGVTHDLRHLEPFPVYIDHAFEADDVGQDVPDLGIAHEHAPQRAHARITREQSALARPLVAQADEDPSRRRAVRSTVGAHRRRPTRRERARS